MFLIFLGTSENVKTNKNVYLTPSENMSLDTTWLINIWIHRDCDSISKACTSSNQTNSQYGEGEVNTKFHSWPRLYLQLIAFGKEKNQFSPIEWCWLNQPQLRASPMTRDSWPTENIFHVFIYFLLCLTLVWYFHLTVLFFSLGGYGHGEDLGGWKFKMRKI